MAVVKGEGVDLGDLVRKKEDGGVKERLGGREGEEGERWGVDNQLPAGG